MLGKPALFGKRDDPSMLRDPRIGAAAPIPAPLNPLPLNPSLPAANQASVAATPAAPAQATGGARAIGENRLIVGPDVKLKGAEILDCDTLVVEGRVEATMDSRVINIAKNGAFTGKVGIDVAEIHGRFDGELLARSQLIIHATGRVSGKIRYGKILIEEGGEISGDVRSLADEHEAPPKGPQLTRVEEARPTVLATLS